MDNIDKIYRFPEVMELSGYSRQNLYKLINRKLFPAQVPLGGGRAVGFLASEIREWQKTRIASRRAR